MYTSTIQKNYSINNQRVYTCNLYFYLVYGDIFLHVVFLLLVLLLNCSCRPRPIYFACQWSFVGILARSCFCTAMRPTVPGTRCFCHCAGLERQCPVEIAIHNIDGWIKSGLERGRLCFGYPNTFCVAGGCILSR